MTDLRDPAGARRSSSSSVNFFYSLFCGPKAGRNPWHANTLEWTAPSPPGHGNFDFQPIVYRGPYEYGSPETTEDYYPQTQPPPEDRRRRQSRARTLTSWSSAVRLSAVASRKR